MDQSNLSKALPEWDWSLGDKTKLNQYKQQLLDKKVEALFILKEGAGAEPVLDYFMKLDNPKLIQSAQVFVQNQYFQSAVVSGVIRRGCEIIDDERASDKAKLK